jgi:hypothetical protein
MRYALTVLACALVAMLAALMVGSTSRVPDPPPVQLVDDARTRQSAEVPARASREPGARGRASGRNGGAVDDEVAGDRASAATSSPPLAAPSSPPSEGDDDEGDD